MKRRGAREGLGWVGGVSSVCRVNKHDLAPYGHRFAGVAARETMQQRIQRLAVVDAELLEAKRKKAAADYYAQYTHKPEINEVGCVCLEARLALATRAQKPGSALVALLEQTSRGMGRSSAPEELVRNPRGARAKMMAKAAAEATIQAQCTFQPKLYPAAPRCAAQPP